MMHGHTSNLSADFPKISFYSAIILHCNNARFITEAVNLMTCDQEVPVSNLGHDSGCTVGGIPQSVPESPAYLLKLCHCSFVSHRVQLFFRYNPSFDAVVIDGLSE